MKTLTSELLLAVSAIFAASFSFNGALQAETLQSRNNFKIAQAEDTLSPEMNPQPNYLGIVSAVSAEDLEIRLSDGTTRNFALSHTLALNSQNVQPGETIKFATNDLGQISLIDNTSNQERFEGELIEIRDGGISLLTPQGESKDFDVSSSTISDLDLAYGDLVKVTTFADIPGAVGICKIKKAAFAPQPPTIRGLW